MVISEVKQCGKAKLEDMTDRNLHIRKSLNIMVKKEGPATVLTDSLRSA